MIDFKPSRQNDNNNSREDITAFTTSLTELRRKYKLETIRFNAAKARHQTHLASMMKEYISANYPFKEGDVVRIIPSLSIKKERPNFIMPLQKSMQSMGWNVGSQ